MTRYLSFECYTRTHTNFYDFIHYIICILVVICQPDLYTNILRIWIMDLLIVSIHIVIAVAYRWRPQANANPSYIRSSCNTAALY